MAKKIHICLYYCTNFTEVRLMGVKTRFIPTRLEIYMTVTRFILHHHDVAILYVRKATTINYAIKVSFVAGGKI